MKRLTERQTIAARLDGADAARRAVNDDPAVIAARARCSETREANDKADREFRRIFDSLYPREGELTRELAEAHPDLFLIRGYYGDSTPWIGRCAITGLPIFEGDQIFERRSGVDGEERVRRRGSASPKLGHACAVARNEDSQR